MSDLIPNPDLKKDDAPPGAPEKPAAPASDPPAQEGGDKFDDFGYPIQTKEEPPKEGDPKPPGDKPAEAPAAEPKKVEKPATGYAGEPPKVDPPPAAPEKPAEPDDFDKALEGLPKEESSKIKEFAKKHNVSVEIAKEFGNLRKDEMKDLAKKADEWVAEQQRKVIETRAAWHKELRDDPTFGGEKFNHNVAMSERVLEEFMPGTKKALTEQGSVLPPYVMRDLANLGKHLYATEKLVTGEPSKPEESKDAESDDPLAFYGSTKKT